MFKKLQKSTFVAALRMGGYIGWYLTVMYICELSLHYYRDDSMLSSVNATFLIAATVTAAVLVVILLLLDFEGLLSDKLFKWLPGVFMAESGIALSLANAGNMTFFAAVAGVAAAFGMLAAMTHLLRVKVGQRLMSISLALALGGLVRLGAVGLLSVLPHNLAVYVSVAVGIIAILTVHSEGFSRTDGPLVSLAEAPPRTIISKVPVAYIFLFVLIGAFYLSHNTIDAASATLIPADSIGFELAAYAAFVGVALLIALLGKLTMLPMIFVVGVGISTAGGLLSTLPYFTDNEARMVALLTFAGLVCVRACVYLFIITFSLDRPHPLFYAMFGYAVAIAGELCGAILYRAWQPELGKCILIMAALMLVGGISLHKAMKKYGYTQDQLSHRHNIRSLIKRKSAELELFDRERTMLEGIVLDGCGVAELSARMLFSHNTVKVLLRPIFEKFEVSSIEELRDYFSNLTTDEEQFLAKVHEAEDRLREEQRREKAQQLIQSYRDRVDRFNAAKDEKNRIRAERAAEQERELEEKAAAAAAMELVMGSEEGVADVDEELTDTLPEPVSDIDTDGDIAEAEAADTAENDDVSEDAPDGTDVDSDDPEASVANESEADDFDEGSEGDPVEDSDEDFVDDSDDVADESSAEDFNGDSTDDDDETVTQDGSAEDDNASSEQYDKPSAEDEDENAPKDENE